MSNSNGRIKIIEKYCDYKEFRNLLKKIDIMPIMHKPSELNKITSGTLYSCITHEIPIVLPFGTKFMREIMIHRSFENGKNLKHISKNIEKISKNFNFYLNNAKKNSKILKNKLRKDALKNNIL